MSIFNGLLVAAFLILLATSAAVVGSMIVLALFDLVLSKKGTPPVLVEMTEHDTEMIESVELDVPAWKQKAEIAKPDQLAA
jgi:hypothetical protein